MAWRVARSLDVLLGQLNRAYPGRSIASDGSIGDAAHATRDSDHNPHYILDGWGIVTARDYTHDPAHGFDAHALAERLRLSRDRRIKYVISNGRIFSSTTSPWTWRPYTGTNPHTKHMHLSVVASRLCDDTTPWSAVTAVLGSRIPDLTATPNTAPEDDVPLTGDEINAIARTVWDWVVHGDTAGNLLKTARVEAAAPLTGDEVNAIGRTVWATVVDSPHGADTAGGFLAAARFDAARAADTTGQALAAALRDQGVTVTTDQLERALRTVLGSLDNPKE